MMDNFNGNSLLFAATNHQHLLDPAIWRRFDDVLFYDIPDEFTRIKLFERFLKPLKREKNIDLGDISKRSEGLSPSDIKMIAIEAMKLSIIDSRDTLTQNDLLFATKRFLSREKLRKTSKGED
jgi:ATP-dependent 26S proteasome regulatory subunit